MKLPVFQHLRCEDRLFCRPCRGSRDWRRTLGGRFRLPGGVVDFQCPWGVPLDGEATAEKQPPPPKRAYPVDWLAPFRPGNAIAFAARLLGYFPDGRCNCEARKKLMNSRGWIWCLRNAKKIHRWLAEERRRVNNERIKHVGDRPAP